MPLESFYRILHILKLYPHYCGLETSDVVSSSRYVLSSLNLYVGGSQRVLEFFVCADSADIRARRASFESRK
jgi:hypothetical protein